MSKRKHGGRTLYLNPEKSSIETELDALLSASDRPQPLMRGFILAGFALSKEGIVWDTIKGRLSHGNDAVSWVKHIDGAASVPLMPAIVQTPDAALEEAHPIDPPKAANLKRKYAAFLKDT